MKPAPLRASLLRTAFLGALGCLGGAGSFLWPAEPVPHTTKFERDRAKMILKLVRQDVEKYYYDPAFHGVDLDAAFAAATGKIESAMSNGQLFGAIAEPVLALDDSHTFFVPPVTSTRTDYGWRMMMVGDRCLVTGVKTGSDAEAKGLKRGDIIVGLDGFAPTRDNFDDISYVYRMLAPRRVVRMKVQTPGSDLREFEVETKTEQGKRLVTLDRSADLEDYLHELEGEAYAGRHRAVDYGDELLLWIMPGFDLSPSQVANDMRQVAKHKSLILDLRGNGGGAVETLQAMVGSFLDGQVKIGDVQSRKRIPTIIGKAAGDAWKGKLIVLIDSFSASASELFARVMQLENRATVVGDRSSGMVMESESFTHRVGDRNMIMFATSITVANIIMKDGQSLEHTGVVPDELVLPTPEDVAAGRDPVLVRAAALCGLAIDPVKAGALYRQEGEGPAAGDEGEATPPPQ